MNLGAGRIVYQDFTRITKAIEDGEIDHNVVLTAPIDAAVSAGKAVHLLGLLSPGGVHSHEDHLLAVAEMAARRGAKRIYLHAILDGRDIGTIVCPHADLKLFMTASIDARADRRHRQLQGQGILVDYDSVKADLIERDERDSQRQTAPMAAADDAIKIDTTELSANEVFKQMLELLFLEVNIEFSFFKE